MGANETIAHFVRKAVPDDVKRAIPLGIRRRVALRMGVTEYDIVGEHVSFREAGYVKASTPAHLLARHNHEMIAIAEALDGRRHRHALELGCGYGRLSPVLAQHTERLTSIDPNPEALAMARRCYPGIEYREAAGNALPFDDDSFDLVVSWTVLQHVPPAQFETVAGELRRVLAPGGTLLLCETTVEREVPYTAETLTWGRTIEEYNGALAPLVLGRHGPIEALERIEGLGTPGTVMVYRATGPKGDGTI